MWLMTLNKAIECAGSKAELARILGITRGAVSQWVEIPMARVWQLQLLHPEWFLFS